jgi:hypothetical protein
MDIVNDVTQFISVHISLFVLYFWLAQRLPVGVCDHYVDEKETLKGHDKETLK